MSAEKRRIIERIYCDIDEGNSRLLKIMPVSYISVPDEWQDEFTEELKELRQKFHVVFKFPHPAMKHASMWVAGILLSVDEDGEQFLKVDTHSLASVRDRVPHQN